MSARWTAILVSAAIGMARASAADAETRVFTVLVDGKPAGEFRLAVRTADDGTETANLTASVQVKSLLGGYRYSYRGSETWKNGQLQRFESASEENGKKHSVTAEATANGMRLSVDGATRAGRLDVFPTTYWRILPSTRGTRAITLLDADTGEEQSAKIDFWGHVEVDAGNGQLTRVVRVHITGPTPATLTYDSRGRLVGQETIEDGHKTVLSLREIQR